MRSRAIAYARRPAGTAASSVFGKKAVIQVVYFVLGVLVSRGTVFGSYAPFGVALAAAAPFGNLAAVVGGSLLGYLLPSAVGESIRYLAAIVAAAAIRWTLNDLKRVREHALFAPLVALGPILATGIAINTVEGLNADAVMMSLTEAVLAAGAAYFFRRAALSLTGDRGLSTLDQQELACVVLTGCVVVLSLAGVTVGSISIGRVLAVLAIVLCAHMGGVSGGSIAGISTGIVFSLASQSLSYVSGAYAFGGLMAGMFAPLGRLGSAGAFIVCNAVIAMGTGDVGSVLSGLYEVMAATLLFMLLPRKVEDRFAALFSRPMADNAKADGLRRSVVMRLDFAAKALSDVTESVEEVSKKLSQMCAPDVNGVYKRVMDTSCRRCGMKAYCWEQNYNSTIGVFNDLTPRLRSTGRVSEEDFAAHFTRRCSKLNELVDGVNQQYREYRAREAAERRVTEVRAVVSDQFSGMSEILADMTQELEGYEKIDAPMAARLTEVLTDYGIHPMEVCCRFDKQDRLTVEIEAGRGNSERFHKPELLKEIAQVCDRAMDEPCIAAAPDCCRVQLCEKPTVQTAVGVCQHVCDNGALCGDHYTTFRDGMGHFVAVISDGMGTGGRAAVDGAMAAGILAKLAKAGLSFDCALRIVNSALAVKSGDESLATLDVMSVDLFSGKAEFRKAGAPVTMVRKKDRVLRIDGPSLPAGILMEIGFSQESMQLANGDWVLMVSDGAVANGDEWLERTLKEWSGEEPQKLAEAVVKEASLRRTDGHDDDITALALRITR